MTQAEHYDPDFLSDSYVPEGEVPGYVWLVENLPSWSARVRYLHVVHKIDDIKEIQRLTNLKYRHVYRILSDFKKQQVPEHTCPVCRNRKG